LEVAVLHKLGRAQIQARRMGEVPSPVWLHPCLAVSGLFVLILEIITHWGDYGLDTKP